MDANTGHLARRAATGDTEAFAALVRIYKAPLHAYVLSRVGDFTWADDLAQEAFIAAFVALPKLRDPARFAPWLRRIADNLCALWFRQLRRDDRLRAKAADGSRPCVEAAGDDREDCVLSALSRLSTSHATAMTLYYCDGLTHAQCGEFLGVSAKAIEGRLRRARRALKQQVIQMTRQTLDRHGPDDSFDDAVEAEIGRLVQAVGQEGSRRPLAQAADRLAILFGRNLARLADLICTADDERSRRAAMRMVEKLDLAGANQALAMALSDDEHVRLNALGALPVSTDGKGVYLVLEAIHDSGLTDEQKAHVLIDLIRRPTLLRGHHPKHVLKRCGLDGLHYARMLLAYPDEALARLTELFQVEAPAAEPNGHLTKPFVTFGTRGSARIAPWLDGDDPHLAITGLKLAEALGRAISAYALCVGNWDAQDVCHDEDKLPLRSDWIVHPTRVDHDACREIGRKVAALTEHQAPEVRHAAAAALGYFDDDLAVAPLTGLARSPELGLAAKATRALGWRYTPERIEPLIIALESAAQPVQAAAEGALMQMRMQTYSVAMFGAVRDAARGSDVMPGLLGTAAEITAMIDALDDANDRVLSALQSAGMSGSCGPWRAPLSGTIAADRRGNEHRERGRRQSELRRRAAAYHKAHPDVALRAPIVYAQRPHWLGVAVGLLPADRPYGERELNKLIAGVGMDYAHTRRALVDEGWMTRARSVYRLTETGRRAQRMEHALTAACRLPLHSRRF